MARGTVLSFIFLSSEKLTKKPQVLLTLKLIAAVTEELNARQKLVIASCLTAEGVTVSLFSSCGLGAGWAVGSVQVACSDTQWPTKQFHLHFLLKGMCEIYVVPCKTS